MDNAKLRQLEQRHKLRVRTGCETCRARRVKCDEAKPACMRCTKAGRICEGYARATTPKSDHAAAAKYRNSAFLVVPQRAESSSANARPPLLRPVSQKLVSGESESHSLHYFTSHTLPSWTLFFDSPLWTRTVLQLSHAEPAIKHGVLALSEMHARFVRQRPIFTSKSDDFAFQQYSLAVKHSNALLNRFNDCPGMVSVQMILVACILFTCFENLAGHYSTANMHLKNGLRILAQHRNDGSNMVGFDMAHVEGVMARFDLQAMTFSDDKSPYQYALELPPDCPSVGAHFLQNDAARDQLVGVLRCAMWVDGVLEQDRQVEMDPEWQRVAREMGGAFGVWEMRFREYERRYLQSGYRDPRTDAGNTLLEMYAVLTKIMMGIDGGIHGDLAWDRNLDEFRTVVELAETLPGFGSQASPNDGEWERAARERPLAPTVAGTMLSVPDADTSVLDSNLTTLPGTIPLSTTATPTSFSPSFELSPIVPLFFTAHRCRDPHVRRRAIRLLLHSRRRDGVWDSYAAGLVSAVTMHKEEGLPLREFGDPDFLALAPDVKSCVDVPESKRISQIYVSVSVPEGRVEMTLKMLGGMEENMVVEYERPAMGT